MMRERVIFATKDNKAIVYNLEYEIPEERSQNFFAARDYFANITWNEYGYFYNNRSSDAHKKILEATDPKNSQFLHDEIRSYRYVRQRELYDNELQTDDYSGPLSPFFEGVDHSVDDAKVPEVIKSLGFGIEPEDREVEVTFNDSTGEYEYKTFGDMQVCTDKRCITIYRNHFKFTSSADKAKMQALIARYRAEKSINPQLSLDQFTLSLSSNKERSLFRIYSHEIEMTEQRDTYLAHEFKHVMNKIFSDSLYLNRGDVRLNIEDAYKLAVEDERSAYLSQVVNCVNKYLQKGDWGDYSMFDNESYWLGQHLSQITDPAQRRLFAMNPANWVNMEMESFETSHRAQYVENQFKNNLEYAVDNMPMSVKEETDHKVFEKIQRLYYVYKIYNPDTGRMETKNLFDCIDDEHQVNISADEYTDIIKPCNDRLTKRLVDFQAAAHADDYDLSLVGVARQVLNDEMHQPRFVGTDEALGVATLDLENQPQQNVPDDQADWSNDLQQYWSQFAGYREVAKNNDVYSFAINNDQVSYSSTHDVAISRGSQYETYKRLMAEPSNRGRAVNFAKTLSEEQALRLYVACVLSGNKPIGEIPTDFSRLDTLNDIPADELQKFKAMQNSGSQNVVPNSYGMAAVQMTRRQMTRD